MTRDIFGNDWPEDEPMTEQAVKIGKVFIEGKEYVPAGLLEQLQAERDEAKAENEGLREALRCMVYETTHLSPEEDDGSHWAKISKETLSEARAALGGDPSGGSVPPTARPDAPRDPSETG